MTLLQSLAIVVVCAAVGVSMAKVSGADQTAFIVMGCGGAGIGTVAVAIGLAVRGNTQEFERRETPASLLGMRLMISGFIMSIIGWLVTVFLWPSVGWAVGFPGAVIGIAGILIHNANVIRRLSRR